MISFAESENDTIHEIIAGDHKFIFCQKGPLYLVSVSRTLEPSKDLLMQLEYLQSQIIFLLTAGVNRLLETRADFDLRNLLSGTEKMFDNLLSFIDHDASIFTNSIHCLPLNEGVRRSVGKILLETRTSSVLYGMIIAKHQMVNLIRPRKHPLFPSDLHLILNFINSGASFRTNETWTPVCLPRFNEKGFMHCYIRYIAEDVCLLLISTKADSFYELSECAKKIVSSLEISGCLKEITTATKNCTYDVSDAGGQDLLHFIYISSVTSQLTQPAMTAPYHDPKSKKRLFRLYQHIHNHSETNQLYYYASKHEIVLAWKTFHVLFSFLSLSLSLSLLNSLLLILYFTSLFFFIIYYFLFFHSLFPISFLSFY
jgi:vacuolar fusion protein MON1